MLQTGLQWLWLAAQRFVDRLNVVEQVRACLEEAGLAFCRHQIAKAKRSLDRHAGVPEIFVVESLGALIVLETTERCGTTSAIWLAVMWRRLSPMLRLLFLTAAGCPDVASVDQQNLSLASLLLAVREDPNIGTDAGVVEHLLRQGDDGFEPVVITDDPLADVSFSRAGAPCEQRRAAKDDG